MLVERKIVNNDDGTIGYVECVYASDNILKTTYFYGNCRLYIAFSRGNTYSYGNISHELYEEFENSESQGRFFHQKINNNKLYPYRKEFTLYPNEVSNLKQIVEDHKAGLEEDIDNE